MLVEIAITKPVQEVVVVPEQFSETHIVHSAAEARLISRGSVDLTKLRDRDDRSDKIVVATVHNLRKVGKSIVGDLTINGELRNYLDGNMLRFNVGAIFLPPLAVKPNVVCEFTSLHMVDPMYERIVDTRNVTNAVTPMAPAVEQLSTALAALSVLGVTIADVYYEGRVVTKLLLSNGKVIDVPKPINIKW